MAKALNKTTIIGNVGRDPEMRYTPSGDAVTSFNVAVSDSWTKDGEKHEKTTWFNVTAWRKLGEVCNEFLSKGSKIYLEGEVAVHAWSGNDGEARASLDLTANQMIMLSPKHRDEDEVAPRGEYAGGAALDDYDDQIPF